MTTLKSMYRYLRSWGQSVGDRPPHINSTSYSNQAQNFWEQWAQTFKESPTQQKIYPQHQWLLQQIEALHPASILEVGCGFGRNIAWLSQQLSYQPKFIGVDFSHTFITQAKDFLKDVPHLQLYTASVAELPDQAIADVVLVHGVFMHIPPEQLQHNAAVLLAHTKQAVLQIEEIVVNDKVPVEQRINEYTYSHNYQKLYASFPDWHLNTFTIGPHNLVWIHAQKGS